MYKWENKNKFIVFLNLLKIDLYSKKVKNEQVESGRNILLIYWFF